MLARIVTGLVQGGVIWGLVEAEGLKLWPATDRPAFVALILMILVAPPGLLSALRQGRFRTEPGRWKDLEFGSARFPMVARKPDCPAS